MAKNLAEFTLGGTDQGNQWMLHTSGAALAGGIQIGLGDGDDTGLVVGPNWIGIQGISARASLTFTGNTNRTFILPSSGGALISDDGNGVDPIPFRAALGETVKITTLAVSDATAEAEAEAVTQLSFTPVAGAIYRFEYLLIAQTAATDTKIALDLIAPTNAASLVGQATQSRSGIVNNERVWTQSFSESPANISSFGFDVADTSTLITLSGILVMGLVDGGDLSLSIRSSNTGAAVSIQPGSVLTITRLN